MNVSRDNADPRHAPPCGGTRLRRGIANTLAGVLLLLECARWSSWLLPETHMHRCAFSGAVCFLAIGLPYLLMRRSPETASFDGRWLGGGITPWLLVLPFTAVLVAMNGVVQRLTTMLFGWHFPGARGLPSMFTPADVATQTALVLVLVPIAEEVLFRGFVLGLLRKLFSPGPAVAIQAALFAAAHMAPEFRPSRVVGSFAMALAFGAWRLGFTGLLPLMVVHGIVNAIAWLPLATIEKAAVTRPECRQMEALLNAPPSEAIPAILVHVGSDDELIQAYAINLLAKRYRAGAKPFVRDALRSNDGTLLDGAMYICQEAGYSEFIPDIRALAISHPAFTLRASALFRLQALGDREGLRRMAHSHPDPATSRLARRLLEPFGGGPSEAP